MLAAVAVAAAAGCAPAGPTPEPTATWIAAPWTAVPAAAATAFVAPTADAAASSAANATATAYVAAMATQLSATVAALAARPEPAAIAPVAAPHTPVPLASCAVPRQPPVAAVSVGADSPAAVQAWWSSAAPEPRAFDGEVAAVDDGGTTVRVRAAHDGQAFEATLTTDVALPLSPGRRVRVVVHDERAAMAAGGAGRGYALHVADDDGLVALVVASGAPLASGAQLLGGERGGWRIEQLRSPCTVSEPDCGFLLFAAPVRFAYGDDALVLGPGQSGELRPAGLAHSYRLEVATSHVLLPSDGAPCANWAPWPLSYRIVRR